MITAYAVVAINIMCIYVCYVLAKERGANTRFWGWMGMLFGPFAVPFVFFAKPKEK
jgi:hypothetical protein|tara:strand:- start:1738 stop:1905 length:168 start_codon:yes stop_codon:yes gene_type:complete